MVEKFPSLDKDINIQIQEGQRAPVKVNQVDPQVSYSQALKGLCSHFLCGQQEMISLFLLLPNPPSILYLVILK
jgi:hypothetical protein